MLVAGAMFQKLKKKHGDGYGTANKLFHKDT